MPQKTQNTLVRLSPDFANLIDAWRLGQLDTPSRPEAIRRLVVRALENERQTVDPISKGPAQC